MPSKFPPKRADNSHIIKMNKPKLVFSEYQKKIFKEINQGTKNVIVIARAGSSKTTSLVEGSKFIPKGTKTLFCAFNKSIQEELKNRLSDRVECSTLHSLGLRGIKQRFPGVEIDNFKCPNIAETVVGNKKDNYDLIESVCKTVSLCKANLYDTTSKVEEVVLQYGIDTCDTEMPDFAKLVLLTLRKCKEQTKIIDFDDMIYFPFIYKMNVGKWDLVFVDEFQDLNRAQIELALSAKSPKGRVIAVGDNRQAIYSWRGADSNMMDVLKTRLNPVELTLPICYRCPTKVVEMAKEFVPDIQAFDQAPEGEIFNIDISELMKLPKPGDVILSRTNAPLIKQCLKLLKAGKPANIMGRDIGDGLFYLVKKSKKKTVVDLLKWLLKWEEDEKEKMQIKYPNASTEVISDKAECIRMFCEDAKSVEDIKSNIKKLFQDGDNTKVILHSSVHRAKGTEYDNVFIFADTLRGGTEEEENIHYVAITRSKKKLYFARKATKYSAYDDKSTNLEYMDSSETI